MERTRGALLQRLELNAHFADDLAAADLPGGFIVVSAGEAQMWAESDGQISILNADRKTMTRVLVAAARQTMTGPTVDLADFIPAPTHPMDIGFNNVAVTYRSMAR
ncbi:hypothetical protein ACFVAJ_16305 [Agromyces sp. NPDC057679]|uniref:hypothetical protein n=1 Tax=Agromyces sp. NPDC057679 TaxID=3346207 RepID=UPI003672335A